MKSNEFIRNGAFAIVSALAATLAYGDPPGRVARLSLSEGQVSFAATKSEANDNWSSAEINWPITGGNRLYAAGNAHAEVQIGAASLRLAENSAIDFTRLDDERVEAHVPNGTLQITLRNWDINDPFVITTPTVSVTLGNNGRYRIDVDDNGESATITVRQGEAQITNGNSRFNLIAPQRAQIRGWNGGEISIERFDGEDNFDRWSADRDRRQEIAYSSRYVAPATPGLYELDQYGQWRDIPEYGYVWTPSNVAADWAPYRHGRWAWVEPWGWTWIDAAPWGYVPSHYGRWVYASNYWAWVPGRFIARPIYAPALVTFISGPGFSVSINAGTPCGWVPLAPHEAYYPHHFASDRYLRSINVPHVRDGFVIDRQHREEFRNQHHPGGVTMVDPRVVVGGLPVPRAMPTIERQVLRDVVRAAPPSAPPLKIGMSLPMPVFAQPIERVHRDDRKWNNVRPDYTIPRHEVDTRVPMPQQMRRAEPVIRQVPAQPAAPVVSEVRRDQPLPLFVREQPNHQQREFRREQQDSAPTQRGEPKQATTGIGKANSTSIFRKIDEDAVRAR